MPNVTFTCEADVANAVNGFIRLVDTQAKAKTGFKEITEAGHESHDMTTRFNHAILELAGGLMTLEAIKEGWTKITEAIEAAIKARADYESHNKPTLTLSQNITNMPAFRARSLYLERNYGLGGDQIDPLRQAVGTKASDENPYVRGDYEDAAAEYVRLAGGNTVDVFNAMRSYREAYGLTVPQAQTNTRFMEEHGHMSPAEQAELMPQVMPITSALKIPLEQVDAVISEVTAAGGKDSQMVRGLRELLPKLGELADPDRKGGAILNAGDDIVTDMQKLWALHDTNPEEFKKIAGKRSVAAIAYIAQHPEKYRDNLALARQDLGKDLVGNEFVQAMNDPDYAWNVHKNQADVYRATVPLEANIKSFAFAERENLSQAGGEQTVQDMFGPWATPVGTLIGKLAPIFYDDEHNPLVKLAKKNSGIDATEEDLQQRGQADAAGYIQQLPGYHGGLKSTLTGQAAAAQAQFKSGDHEGGLEAIRAVVDYAKQTFDNILAGQHAAAAALHDAADAHAEIAGGIQGAARARIQAQHNLGN